MARKAARLAKLHAATDRQAGERVLIKPQQGGGYVVGGADPNREEMEVVAFVSQNPGIERTASSGKNDGANVTLRLSPDTIKFRTSALPYKMAEGDLVQLIEVEDAPTYRVSRTAPYGTDRTILFLVRASR